MTEPGLERALTLAKASKFGALGTIMRSSAPADAGFPFATLVAYALVGGQPLFLLSDLAEHTQNLRADPRASLLVSEDAGDEALARGRLTVVGRCVEIDRDRAEVAPAYLALHPQATDYLLLKDFHFWRLAVDSVRHVGGFGRMGWVSGAEWLSNARD